MAIAIVTTPERTKPFTYADYLNLPDDGKRYEIIDGELYMVPAPTLDHQRSVREFLFVLTDFFKKHPIGEVFPAPTDVIFSEINVLQPDIVVVLKEKFDILTRENIRGTPDLVLEVLSPGTEKRDRTEKLEKYARFGVQEYWMVNEDNETVEIWRRRGNELVFHALVDRTQTLTTPLLSGLEIPLEEIFLE
jgi:Uma2 family endonuclease